MDLLEWDKLTAKERYTMMDVWNHMPYEGEVVSIIDDILFDMLVLRYIHQLHHPTIGISNIADVPKQEHRENVYSVYFDASATPGSCNPSKKGSAGLGYEIRGGNEGEVIHSDSRMCKYRANITVLEASALNFAAHAAIAHIPKSADVIFYGDNSNAWDMFRDTAGYENIYSKIMKHFKSIKYSHINRNGNKAAHKLAYKANRSAQQCKQ
jgi:hypothetical protein